VNGSAGCSCDRERFADDISDTSTSNVVSSNYCDSPVTHSTQVLDRIGEIRDGNLNNSSRVYPELLDQAPDRRAVADTVTNVEVRIDRDETRGRHTVTPAGHGDGDGERVVASNRDHETGSGHSRRKSSNRPRFVTVRVDNVTEIVSNQAGGGVYRMCRRERLGITGNHLANRGRSQVGVPRGDRRCEGGDADDSEIDVTGRRTPPTGARPEGIV
jgi:hypothetical protein